MESPLQPDSWLKQPVPMPYLTTTLEVGCAWGIDKEQLLAAFDINLEDGQVHIPLNNLLAVIRKLHECFPAQPLALEIGQRLSPTAYGSLGFAMLCSDTLDDCLNIMSRYWKLINMSVSSVTITSDSRYCTATLDINPWLMEPLRRLWIEASLTSWKRCFEVLCGERLEGSEILLAYPQHYFSEPSQLNRAEQRYGVIRYNQTANQFRIPIQLLHQPLPMANILHKKMAIELCERDAQTLDRITSHPVSQQVKALLVPSDTGYPSFEQLADALCVSVRTLRRQLSKEGTGFKQLLDESRRHDALQLLGDPRYRIQRISELLGFGDPANFARCFRNWTGQTPSEFRKKLLN